MGPYLESVANVMLDRSPEEWIEGIMVALFLALALAGASTLCRRWTKATDDTMLVVGPAIIVIFAGMVLAAGYVQMKVKRAVVPAGIRPDFGRPEGRPFRGPEFYWSRMADRIFDAADADGDGRVSTDEAAAAATKFIEEADGKGEGALDREALTAAVRDRMRPPGGAPPPPMAPVPGSPPPS